MTPDQRAAALPPLPDGVYYYCYTADKMRDYGAACAAAERERVLSRCASLTWHQRDPSKWCSDDVAYAQGYNAAQDEIAAAIRQETP